MKKTKIIALVLTLALLVTQFVVLGSVPALAAGGIDDVPDYPDYAVVELTQSGKTGTWGAQYNYTQDNIYVATTGGSVDAHALELIEFDIYVADSAAFTSAISGQDLRFYVASGSSRFNNRRTYAFASQVTQDGWNHIVIDRENKLSTDSTDFYSLKWVGLSFFSNSSSSNPIGSTQVRIANVCGSLKPISRTPAYPAYAAVELTKEGKKGTWGAYYHYTTDNMYTATVATVDISGMDQIEFDIYIEDLAAFQSAMYPKNPRFYVASGASKNDSRSAYAYYTQITQSGWNHVVLDRTVTTSANSADFSSIKWVGLADWSGSHDANAIGSTQVRFANVCGTMKEINRVPAYPGNAAVEIHRDGRTYENVSRYNDWANKPRNLESPVDISGVDQIEFDLYIGDLTAFRNQISLHTFYFVLKTGGDSSHRARYQFTLQVTQSGWNHIILQKDAKDDIGETPNFASVTAYVFDFWTSDTTANPNKSTIYRIANVCGTNVSDYPAYEHTAMYKLSASNYWGGTANNSNFLIGGLTPTDISATEQVEFDVFVQNYENFASATSGGEIRFRFGDANDYYIDLNVKSKITHGGWNHVAAVWLPSSVDPNTDRYMISNNNLNLTAIKWIKFYSTVGINWETVGKTRFANVCFTKKATYKTHSVVLADNIGLNFFMDLSKLNAEQKIGSYMTFAIANGDATLQAEYKSDFTNATGAYHGFTCPLSSVQMAESVTPTFHYSTGETVTGAAFSVKDYIDYVAENSGSFPDAVVDLVKSLGDYGHYAQIYLGGRNGWVAGTDYTALAKYRAADYGSDDYTAKATDLSSAAVDKDIDDTAVTGLSYSLNFDSNTFVNVELHTTDSLFASATVDGKLLYVSASGKLRTQGLSILQLGEPIAITGKGSSNTNTFTVTLSGLSYIRAILNSGSTSAAAKNAVSALYDYYQAAVAYQATLS